jgi:septum formation protein
LRGVILASGSPRRRAILEQLGIPFRAVEPAVDETAVVGGLPADLVQGRALAKARAVAAAHPEALVVAADTAVVADGEILGKPRDAAEAEAMLRRLVGRDHVVVTGLAVIGRGRQEVAADAARVWMRHADAAAIAAYVRSGEPLDKAGAYAIQGRGAALVTRVDGDFYTVVGLPVGLLVDVLARFGLRVPLQGGTGTEPPDGGGGAARRDAPESPGAAGGVARGT